MILFILGNRSRHASLPRCLRPDSARPRRFLHVPDGRLTPTSSDQRSPRECLDDKADENSRKEARTKAVQALGRESDAARQMLDLILPLKAWNPADARRERRILHPDVFARYFQLTLAPAAVSEAAIEDFAE